MTSIQQLQAVIQAYVAATESAEVEETRIQKEKVQVEDLSHPIWTSDRLRFLVAVMTLLQWPGDSNQYYVITNLLSHFSKANKSLSTRVTAFLSTAGMTSPAHMQ